MKSRLFLTIALLLLSTSALFAYGGSEPSMFTFGLTGSSVASEQKDINKLRSDANTREGGLSIDNLTGALEFGAILQLRIPSSIIGFQLRTS